MIKDNFICCPKCGKKILKIKSNSIIKNVELYCRHCKNKFDINIESKRP